MRGDLAHLNVLGLVPLGSVWNVIRVLGRRTVRSSGHRCTLVRSPGRRYARTRQIASDPSLSREFCRARSPGVPAGIYISLQALTL